jgi:hypothetical protein
MAESRFEENEYLKFICGRSADWPLRYNEFDFLKRKWRTQTLWWVQNWYLLCRHTQNSKGSSDNALVMSSISKQKLTTSSIIADITYSEVKLSGLFWNLPMTSINVAKQNEPGFTKHRQ